MTVTAVIADPIEAADRLERLGLSASGLERVVASGAGGYTSATSFHPRSAPGTFLYHETYAALGRLLLPGGGWGSDDVGGQPRIWNASRRICIIVQTGDEMTGIDGSKHPTTRHPHGSATTRKVIVNSQQMELPFIAETAPSTEDAPFDTTADTLTTWVLLVCVEDGQARGELSVPLGILASGKPGEWRERVLIAPTDIGTGPDATVQPVTDDVPDTDFDVSWAK